MQHSTSNKDKNKIGVVSYAGYRGEEAPRSFSLGDVEVKVVAIIRSWIEESLHNRGRKRFFKVKGDDGYTYTLCHDEGMSAWFVTDR